MLEAGDGFFAARVAVDDFDYELHVGGGPDFVNGQDGLFVAEVAGGDFFGGSDTGGSNAFDNLFAENFGGEGGSVPVGDWIVVGESGCGVFGVLDLLIGKLEDD